MPRKFNVKMEPRPRQFWLRGLALCWVLLMAELAVFMCMLLHSANVATSADRLSPMLSAYDVPVVDYPQYRDMMRYGVVYIVDEGLLYPIFKQDFSNEELKKLSLRLRAE